MGQNLHKRRMLESRTPFLKSNGSGLSKETHLDLNGDYGRRLSAYWLMMVLELQESSLNHLDYGYMSPTRTFSGFIVQARSASITGKLGAG